MKKRCYLWSIFITVLGIIFTIVGALNGGIKQLSIVNHRVVVVHKSDKQLKERTPKLADFSNIYVYSQNTDVTVKSGKDYKVRVKDANDHPLNVKTTNNRLIIEEKSRFKHIVTWGKDSNNKVEITVPTKADVKTINVNGDASRVNIADLTVGRVKVEVDAGRLTLKDAAVDGGVYFEGDAGNLITDNSKIASLYVDGVDSMKLTMKNSQLKHSKIEADSGVFKIVDSQITDFGGEVSNLKLIAKNSEWNGHNSLEGDTSYLKLIGVKNEIDYDIEEGSINYFGSHSYDLSTRKNTGALFKARFDSVRADIK